MDLKISQLKESPDPLRLLHDFDFFEHTFLSPYSVTPSNLGDKKLVQVYHSDPNNAEALVDEMMQIENVNDYHKENDQCDATTKSVVATTCDGVNGSNNNEELELDFSLVDPKYLEYLDEVLNGSGTVVTEEGEAGYGGGDSTQFDENELIDFDKYLEKVLDEETTTQELIHNATDQTEAVLKSNNIGCENNVKKWKTRKRLKKGTPEFAQRKEKYKLNNRVAAAKSFEKKQAYIKQLELQVQKLRLEIAFLKTRCCFTEQQILTTEQEAVAVRVNLEEPSQHPSLMTEPNEFTRIRHIFKL